MAKPLLLEQWKPVEFNVECVNSLRLQISNFGRVQSFTQIHPNGNILKGTITNGYNIIRFKLFKQREEKMAIKLQKLKLAVTKLTKKITILQKEKGTKAEVDDLKLHLKEAKKKYELLQKKDSKERVINYHALIHRLVAEYFLPAPTENQIFVAHLDYNKQNNQASNLRWMTAEENFKHQQNSPHVKQDQTLRKERRFTNAQTKLTVTKVMFLKKLINEGKPTVRLAKQFKVTTTQIFRIRNGQNWADIPAAT